jgi:hypothetical protein
MVLADRLHKSVEEIIKMSTLELVMWAGYITYDNQEKQKTMKASKMKGNPVRGR